MQVVASAICNFQKRCILIHDTFMNREHARSIINELTICFNYRSSWLRYE